MSFFLPLLLAGALVVPATSSSVSVDDKRPRARSAVIDTAAHRQLAADLVKRASTAAESGSWLEARAHLLVANTMLRESGGLEETPVYNLVRVDYRLDRFVEAAALLDELSDDAFKKGDATLAANAAFDAAMLYNLAGNRVQAASSVSRVRSLVNDPRISKDDRLALKKRLG